MSNEFELDIDGAAFQVTSVRGREAVGEPFSFDIVARPFEPAPVEVGAAATLSWPLSDDARRTVVAIVDAVEESPGGSQEQLATRGAVTLRLVPRMAFMADGIDHEVFLDQDALQIAEAVFSANGVTVEKRCSRTPAKRAQCLQPFESDLAFVTRILAEEGILWFLHPDEPDVVVLVDNPSGFTAVPGDAIVVRPSLGLVAGRSAWAVMLSNKAVTDKVTFRDFDFKAPSVDLTVEAKEGQGSSERYEFRPGYTDPSLGETLAKIRLEQFRRHKTVLTGFTNARDLAPGTTIEIEEGPLDEVNGTWVVTQVEHGRAERDQKTDSFMYAARFHAVPKDVGYRPERTTQVSARPGFGGVETMDVTGASGSEIHTEEFGRSKARFRWERTRPLDDTASAWFRSVQPPTSGGFFLPRVGWQVLTAHFQGSPDEPLELGRLYTGADPPPAALPGKKVCSDFVSRTTPGGGSVNGLQMNDTAGNEGMAFTASKDFNEKTANDKATTITSNDDWTIGSNRKTVVTKVLGVSVGGAQTYTVGGSRTVNVDANKVIQAASESITVGGARIFNIGGDNQTQASALGRLVGAAKMVAPIEHSSQLVTGASSILVGGSWNQLAGLSAGLDVGGANIETVAGAKSIKALTYGMEVKGLLTENFASKKVESGTNTVDSASSKANLTVGGGMKVKGADVIFVGSTKIQIKAGGVSIKITSGSVTIDGKFDSSQSAVDDSNEDYD